MRQTIGGTWLFQLMILFILLFAAFIILTLNYSRTVRVKNELIDMFEKYEGLNSRSIELVNTYLTYNGYTTQGICTEEDAQGMYGAFDLSRASLEPARAGVKYYYCVRKFSGANTTNYYQVTLFYKFNLPIIGDASGFSIKGTTSNFQSHDEKDYCYTTSGKCTYDSGSNSNNNNGNTNITYTVRFDLNGGTGDIRPQQVSYGGVVRGPGSPTRNGYAFAGWQLNGKDYNFNTKVYSNMTLTAKWEVEN